MELSKADLEIILQWYSLADSYYEERGNYLSNKSYELKDKILNQLKKEESEK